MQKLFRHPGMGRLREELAPRIRSFRTSAMLFYREDSSALAVVRFSTAHATLRAVLSETRPTLVRIAEFDHFTPWVY
jgi:hypothetical protein